MDKRRAINTPSLALAEANRRRDRMNTSSSGSPSSSPDRSDPIDFAKLEEVARAQITPDREVGATLTEVVYRTVFNPETVLRLIAGAGLVEGLRPLIAAANEPQPKPLPEQDSRVGEAMAGRADTEARSAWRSRVDTARAALAVELAKGVREQ